MDVREAEVAAGVLGGLLQNPLPGGKLHESPGLGGPEASCWRAGAPGGVGTSVIQSSPEPMKPIEKALREHGRRLYSKELESLRANAGVGASLDRTEALSTSVQNLGRGSPSAGGSLGPRLRKIPLSSP